MEITFDRKLSLALLVLSNTVEEGKLAGENLCQRMSKYGI